VAGGLMSGDPERDDAEKLIQLSADVSVQRSVPR
jgi:hypothetical protein